MLIAHLGIEIKDLCADIVTTLTSLLLQESLKLLLFARGVLDQLSYHRTCLILLNFHLEVKVFVIGSRIYWGFRNDY